MAPPTQADFSALTSAISSLTAAMAANKNTAQSQLKQTPTQTSKLDSLTKQIKEFGVHVTRLERSFEKITSSVMKTQKDFGLTIGSAAKLQISALQESISSIIKMFSSIDLTGLGDVAGAMFDTVKSAGKAFISGGSVKDALSAGAKNIMGELTKERPGRITPLAPDSKEVLAATKAIQDEFGIINNTLGASLAQYAKTYGLSVEQLVQSRRIFSTIARGDLSQVDRIQTRFFDIFQAKGMTPKIALEAITKYADLIARNGTRFADSFARAAADAKKIGIDLGKIDQVGDNIIDNFEGFLESQAELGAMGFGFDTSRIAALAATGDTGALLTELRSQLAGMGKDITRLSRPERLALESAFGINISELQRLAAGTPEITAEDLQKDSNTLLNNILTILVASNLVLGVISAAAQGINAAVNAGGSVIKLLGLLGNFLFSGTGALLVASGVVGGAYMAYQTGKESQSALGAVGKGAGIGSIAGLITALGLAIPTGGATLSMIPYFMAGGAALGSAISTAGYVNKGDDVVSRPGYGNRILSTPTQKIALNNNDNIVAYADDMIAKNAGIELLSKGAIAANMRSNPVVNVDLSRLEAKLENIVMAIASMQVQIDGTSVGKILVNTSDAAMTAGVFKPNTRATF